MDLFCQLTYYTDFTCTALALKNRKMSPGWARQKYLGAAGPILIQDMCNVMGEASMSHSK